MRVNDLNILTNFSEITNTTKRFYCILRLGKKMLSVSLKNKLPPPKEKPYKKPYMKNIKMAE